MVVLSGLRCLENQASQYYGLIVERPNHLISGISDGKLSASDSVYWVQRDFGRSNQSMQLLAKQLAIVYTERLQKELLIMIIYADHRLQFCCNRNVIADNVTQLRPAVTWNAFKMFAIISKIKVYFLLMTSNVQSHLPIKYIYLYAWHLICMHFRH